MDANELGRWTRFAAKGGIGKCFAVQDCVAEEAEDLMFLKDDEIVVLMQLPGQDDIYLGYCEGVVGRFRGSDVRFRGRLKKPVMAKRSSRSLSRSSSRPSSSLSFGPPHSRESLANAARESPLPPAPRMSQSHSIMTLSLDAPTGSPSASVLSSPLLASNSLLPPCSPHIPSGDESLHIRTTSHASHSSSSTAIDSAPRTPADCSHQDADSLARIASLSRQVDSPSELDEDDTIHAEVDKTATSGHFPAHQPEQDPSDALRYGADDVFDEEPSTRISIALSDGDGETGIGLSLLQDFANGVIDDVDSTHSGASTPEPAEQPASPLLADKKHTPSIRSFAASGKPSIYSSHSAKQSNDALSPEGPVSPSSAPPSPREVLSRNSGHPSFNSYTDSDYCAEEWEGASDIYDNYRYSRYSMASRASRLSKGSMYTVASAFGLEAPPPVPFDGRRPSVDSARQNSSLGGERFGPTTTTSSSVEDIRRTAPANPPRAATSSPKEPGTPEGKRVPPPLELKSSHHAQQATSPGSELSASPLINAFNSPMSSPTPGSATFSPMSPFGTTTLFSNVQSGAASALRQILEQERGSRPASPGENTFLLAEPLDTSNARLSLQPIVIQDNEGPPETAVLASPTSPRSASSSSQPSSPPYLSEKKRINKTTYIVANQAPPPPYTPMSPTSGSADEPLLASPHSPPPQQASQARLQPGARPRNLELPQNDFVRRSIFAPHPHAPKPMSSPNGSSGPMYGRTLVSPQMPGASPGSVIDTMHRALGEQADPRRRGRVTIYAKFEHDLASSVGPVPVSFTLEPPNNIPAHKMRFMAPPTPAEPSTEPEKDQPRANFFPEAKKLRPRSRSFSGFDSAQLKLIVPDEGQSIADDNAISQSVSLNALTKRSRSTSNASSTSSPIPPPPTSSSVSGVRLAHKPSPLSLSQNNVVAPTISPPYSSSMSLKSPASPAQRSPVAVVSVPTSPVMSPLSLGQASNVLSPSTSSSPLPTADTSSAVVARSVSGSSDHHSIASTSPLRYRPKHILRTSRSSNFSNSNRTSAARETSPSRSSMQGRPSVESEGSRLSEIRSVISPSPSLSPPMPQALRSKLSLPTLKIKSSDRSVHSMRSEDRSPTLSITPSITPSISPSENQTERSRVQIEDVDFELVMPSGQLSVIEEDRSSSPLPNPVRPEMASSLRAASPAFSMFSGIGARTAPAPASRTDMLATITSESKGGKQSEESKEGVEAHRQRELRWISAISSVPAAQARKNKKVRKLLWEGVPASVRYIVWAHLTDSKAKRTENVYYKLTQRERVPAAANIERDLRRVFPEDHQLHDGSLLNVLQAYLMMVPDTHYSRGLTVIAGHLLLQSPEEDAFWTFVSLMDTHVRSYFSASPAQMEIDSTLFGKAVESNDSAMAKKVFVEMDIPPTSLCRPWFTALFLEALPLEHSQRVWDIFLFEGAPFLFRVGLAIMMRCKQQVMQCAQRDMILNLLLHPPASMLPATADAFLELTTAVKLKDEDVRKQRAKLAEAHVKRQNLARTFASQAGLPGLPAISLPRK